MTFPVSPGVLVIVSSFFNAASPPYLRGILVKTIPRKPAHQFRTEWRRCGNCGKYSP